MKRSIIIMYASLLLLSGCGRQQTGWQTGDVTLVRAMGLDVDTDGVRISAAVNGAGEEPTAQVFSAQGQSIAQALQQLRSQGEGFVHCGHVDQLMLSEGFARDNACDLMDFVARDREIGPGARIWVLRGGTAQQAAACTGELGLTARLEQLAARSDAAVAQLDCTLTRLMSVTARQGSLCAPALRIEQDGESMTLQPAGYAVFRQGKLVGFLDTEQGLGLELLCGKGAGQTVQVPLSDVNQVVLRVARAQVECEPLLEGGRLIGVDLRFCVEMEVAQGGRLTLTQTEWVQRQVEEVLCRRVVSALACAQLWDADFAGIEQKLSMAGLAEDLWGDFRALDLWVAMGAKTNWPADMTQGGGHGQ